MAIEKKPVGRPRKYDGAGAPKLMLRLDPPVHARVSNHPEGPRAYITRLVLEDLKRESEGAELNEF